MRSRAEAAFTTKFRLWAKENLATGAYEIKHTRGKNRFLTRELKDHQYHSLLAAATGSFAYKIPDDGLAYKPFDMFVMRGVPAFVVIAYPTEFVLIHVKNWPKKKASLTRGEASFIASSTWPLSAL